MAASIMQIVILPVGIGRQLIVEASKHNPRM